ncbi:OmpA family protein [Aurantibacillus circumpalustris]|uniref:OmpA family protein n=1 Tax=Aurantibacillus circumpalustris TaxID=3036359 RepID=UPI00295A96AC|nr:OmpA family protein [Aurantibacillus circumpalustris]
MKKLVSLVAVVIAVFFASCAPVYKCSETVPEKKLIAGKRLKAVVVERNELCSNLSSKEAENSKLKSKVDSLGSENGQLTATKASLLNERDVLQKNNTALQGKYDNLINESLSKANQYDKALKAKSEELNAKEKLLSEREKSLRDLQSKIARQDSITKRLNDIIRKALLGFNSDELSVEIKNGKVYVSLSDKLLFKSGSASIESKGKDALKLLADVLDKNTDIDILVEGHTDNIPIKTAVYKDNWDLSVVRATSIVRILTEDYKIPASRLTASGKGEFFPKASNETSEGRAKNRRTEIILSPKLDEIMKLLNGK